MKLQTYDKIIKFFKDRKTKKLEKILNTIRKNTYNDYKIYFEEFINKED